MTAQDILDLFFPRSTSFMAPGVRFPSDAGKELLQLIKEELMPYHGDED